MSILRRFLQAIDNISEWMGRVFSIFIALMMLVITYEVVARYFFNAPTIWALETTTFLLAGCGALGGAYVLLHRRHINVEILYDRLRIRARAIMDLITALLFFLFIYFFLINALDMAIESAKIREYTDSYFAPPIYPLKIAIAVGVFFVLLQGFAKFIRDLVMATMGEAAAKRLEGISEGEKE